MNRIESNRRDLNSRGALRKWASPALHSVEHRLEQVLADHARGAVLDVGCGSMPYRKLVLRTAETYDGLDIEARTEGVRFIASATDMSPVSNDSYDTVICNEVIEHIPDPDKALAEIARVLKPDGTLVLGAPFLARLHEEPHDYMRFTEHALRSMCAAVDLHIDEMHVAGALGSFLGHQFSTALVGGTWHIPGIKWLAYGVNAGLVVAPSLAFDRALGRLGRRMPLGYIAVATPAPQGSDL